MPIPPLYTIDEALYSKKGTLNNLNISLPELALIPALLPTPTLLLMLFSLQQAPLRQVPF